MKRITIQFAAALLGLAAVQAQNTLPSGFTRAGVVAPSSQASFQTRLNSIVGTASTSAAPGSQVYFSPCSPEKMNEMAEDLNVLGFILKNGLEKALGERGTEYRLGVPMLLRSDFRGIEAGYIEGFGVLVKLQVGFPLVNSGGPEKPKQATQPATEWEKARQAIYQTSGDINVDQAIDPEPPRFDEKLVAALKTQIFESLKNASNLRHVSSDESITVVALGGPNAQTRAIFDPTAKPEDRDQNKYTIMTIQIRKPAAGANAEQLAKDARVTAYFDSEAIHPAAFGAARYGASYGPYTGR